MRNELKHWKTDVPSGLIVFLVAIPLCLGIALASGAPALSGIIAGIVGGLVVTLFSNSSLGVSGPAAGLVAIVLPAIQYLGFQNFLLAVVLGGVIQFLLGCFRAGTIGYYFPTAVIKGMLVAIGLIIILKQIPHAFGYDKDYEGDLAFVQSDGYNTFTELSHAIEASTPSAAIISVICLAILILWETKLIKRFSWSKIIQGPLVAVIAGILLGLGFSMSGSMPLGSDHLVSLPDGTKTDRIELVVTGSEENGELEADANFLITKQGSPVNGDVFVINS
ncbi:MAG: SulP family inorganic anion transporter, partial [Rubripirellula sp.]